MDVWRSSQKLIRGGTVVAMGMLLAMVAPVERTGQVAEDALLGGGVVVPSYGDSGDFDIDGTLFFGEPGYADSPDFGVNTLLSISTPGFGTSGFFGVNTRLTRRNPV